MGNQSLRSAGYRRDEPVQPHSSLEQWKIVLPQVVGWDAFWSWWATKGMDSSKSFGKSATDRPSIVIVCITSSVEGETNAWLTFGDWGVGGAGGFWEWAGKVSRKGRVLRWINGES